tara:strand:+ start:2283 stop:3443 length:1161 start_codon:yes stop_codon:yes gene_type:complete
MPINIGNGNLNLNTGLKAVSDFAGRQIKSNITFDGSNLRISGRENFIRKVQNRATKGELASLYRNGKTTHSLTFPRDLDDEHYIMINAIKRTKQTVSEPKGKEEIMTSIVLPIPGNLQVQYQAQYENQSLGQMGAMAAGRLGLATFGRGVSDATGRIINRVKAMSSNDASQSGAEVAAMAAAAGFTLAGAKVAGMLGAVIGAGGIDNVVAGTMLNEGIAFNPHMAVIFKGVDFRTHAFEYKFVARNQAESDTLKGIIHALHYHMLPANTMGSRQGSVGIAFDYPEEFKIAFAPAVSHYLYQIGTCVLTSMTVNYNGESIPTFFEHTGAPVSITMNLSFQEIAIQTKGENGTVQFNNANEQPVDVAGTIQTVKQSSLSAINRIAEGP